MAVPRLTVCLLAAPNEPGLLESIASARTAADDLLVGCTSSAAEAAALAERLGVRVLPIHWTGSFAAARNALLEGAPGDWVLMLDADEQLELASPDLLRSLAAAPGTLGYWLPIESPTEADGSGTTWLSYQVRLFRNLPIYRYEGAVGERLPDRLLSLAAEQPVPAGIRIRHTGHVGTRAEARSRRILTALGKLTQEETRDPWTALALGGHFWRTGAQAEACRLYESTSVDGLPGAMVTRARGEALLALERAEEAAVLLAGGCGRHSAYTDLWWLQGRALLRLGRTAEADQLFRRCLDLGPAPPLYPSALGVGDVLPLLDLGGIRERAGDVEGALDFYQEAYRARPALTESLYAIGRVYALQGDARRLPGALKELVAPTTADQWLVLADVLSSQRQYRSALRCADTAAALGGNPSEVGVMRGYCLLGVGKAAAAGEALAGVDPGYEWAEQASLLALIAAWCSGECQVARRRLAALSPGLDPGLHSAARALHLLLCRREEPLPEGGDWGQAGGELLLQAVDALLAAGLGREAEAAAALMARTGWAGGYRALAALFRQRRRLRLAHHYFDLALKAGRQDFDLLYALAELELRERNWPRALRLATEAVRLAPDDPRPYLLKARIFRALGIDLLRQASRRWQDPEAARMLAEMARGVGP